MKSPWVVFIESNTTGTGWLFVKAAAEHGFSPVVLAEKPKRYSYLKQNAVDYICCDTGSYHHISQVFESLRRERPIAGVLSSSEYFLEIAAIFASEYGLPGADPVALRTCRNKWTQRKMLQQSGLAVPKFERVTSIPDACLALDRIALPVVVKPSTGSGSVCVRLCRTLPEVVEHMELLLSRTTNERGMPVCPEILIEEYLLGDEYSVETFGEEVLGITRKHVSAEPFFVELGHDFPAVIDAELAANISMVSRNALSAMGLAWGPTHIELRVTSNGPVIVEINPRLAGGFIPEIVRLAYNIDMIRETVRLATGANVNISPGYSAHASIRFLVPQTAGVIKAIRGVEDAMQIRGVVDVRTYRSIGDSVRIEHDFRDRIGHVIACDELAMNAARNSDVASNKIHFEIRA